MKKYIRFAIILILFHFAASNVVMAQEDANGFGQIIQINTQLHSFLGKPIWLLMIRDVDHNQNISYVYDIKKGENYWLAPTAGRNYLIIASTIKFSSYQARHNLYHQYQIKNFCHLESNGHIMKGQSLYVTITGDLSPNSNNYNCHVSKN